MNGPRVVRSNAYGLLRMTNSQEVGCRVVDDSLMQAQDLVSLTYLILVWTDPFRSLTTFSGGGTSIFQASSGTSYFVYLNNKS